MAEHKMYNDKILKCLDQNEIEAARSLMDTCRNLGIETKVYQFLFRHLNEDVEKSKPLYFEGSLKLLDYAATKFDSEDVLLSLLQEFEKLNQNDDTFLILIIPLKTVLLNLPRKRCNSFVWGLNAIHMYMNKVEVPENFNLDKEDQILMDADPLVGRIGNLYLTLVSFYDPLVEAFQDDRKYILFKFLVRLLGKPLSFLDLTGCFKTKSRARCAAEDLIHKIMRITPDIFSLLETQRDDPTRDLVQIDDLALGSLFYLVLVEKIDINRVLQVYDPIYVFQNSLRLVTELLRQDNQFCTSNALDLATTLLHRISGLKLSHRVLDSVSHSQFCKTLINVIIFNQLEHHRKKALKIFKSYLFQFDSRGRFLLIYNLMKIMNHSGIIGYVITQYKDMLKEELEAANLSVYFKGSNLFILLDLFCYLHKGEESDLIELADQIVATLNLLRYLAIRDKTNASQIWNHFEKLRENYLEVLKKGLILSRGHYELKIKDLKSECDGKGDRSNVDVSVSVSGHKLENLPMKENFQVLNAAMTSFDIMESLLGRLNELIVLKHSTFTQN